MVVMFDDGPILLIYKVWGKKESVNKLRPIMHKSFSCEMQFNAASFQNAYILVKAKYKIDAMKVVEIKIIQFSVIYFRLKENYKTLF